MLYLQQSSFGSFGRLKSSNCLVDSRWLVKITDYGMNFARKDSEPLDEVEDCAFYTSKLEDM